MRKGFTKAIEKKDEKPAMKSGLEIKFVSFLQQQMTSAGFTKYEERQIFNPHFLHYMIVALKHIASEIKAVRGSSDISLRIEESRTIDSILAENEILTPDSRMNRALELFIENYPTFLEKLIDDLKVSHLKGRGESYMTYFSSVFMSLAEMLTQFKAKYQRLCDATLHNFAHGVIVNHKKRKQSPVSVPCAEQRKEKKKVISDNKVLKVTERHTIYCVQSGSHKATMKVLNSLDPTEEELEKWTNEFEIANIIDHPAFRFSLKKTIYNERKATLLEWAEGCPLSSYNNGEALTLIDFLSVAREIVSSVLTMHMCKIMHLNLSCDHIIIEKLPDSVKIIGCGSAMHFKRKAAYIPNQQLLLKDLRYVSPEQIGKMRMKIDFRSDFYSLGLIFYKLLTGKCAFESSNPLELVRMHLSKEPIPPCCVNSKIPMSVSDMISKLIKKNPEDRYQSAAGIMHDLDLFISEYHMNQGLNSVEIAQHDEPQEIFLPQRLYGRANEVKMLKAAFNRLKNGSMEIVLIKGNAGTGKSRLARELVKPSFQNSAIYVSGKCDKAVSKPYAVLIQAFDCFCEDLLLHDSDTREFYADKIREAIGDEAKILTDQISNLHHIIGKVEQNLAEATGREAKNRFTYVLTKFFKAICSGESPLVLVLDDLHWLDPYTKDFLSTVMIEKLWKNFMVVGTYRDGTDENNPMKTLFQTLKENNANVTMIKVGNLKRECVHEIISDSLHISTLDSFSLTALVYHKSKGNPFHLFHILQSMIDDGLIFFCQNSFKWNLDCSIGSKNMKENILDLMCEKFYSLEVSAQTALRAASCLGSPFLLSTLKCVTENNDGIDEAISAGFIAQHDGSGKWYRFSHDLICQAVSSVLSENRDAFMFGLGKKLWKQHPKEQIDDNLLVIANLLRHATHLSSDYSEKLDMVNLFHDAAKKFIHCTDFDHALEFVNIAIELLGKKTWESHHVLNLKLHNVALKASFCAGNETCMNLYFDEVSENAKSPLDLVNAFHYRIQSLNEKQLYNEAVQQGIIILNKVGDFNFSSNPSDALVEEEFNAAKDLVLGKKDADISEMDAMESKEMSAVMKILNDISFSSFFADARIFSLVVSKIVELTCNHGFSKKACVGFALFGIVLSNKGDDADYRFGRLALLLLKKANAKELLPKVYIPFYSNINVRHSSVHESLDPFLKSFDISLEVGNIENAELSSSSYASFAFISGKNLKSAINEIELIKEKLPIKSVRFQVAHQAILNLIGNDLLNTNPAILKGREFDYEAYLNDCHDPFQKARCFLYSMILAYIFGDYKSAQKFLKLCKPLSMHIRTFNFIIFVFYEGLISLAIAKEDLDVEEDLVKNALDCIATLKELSMKSPQNCLNKAHLLVAELASLRKNDSLAAIHYDEAINVASKFNFVHEEAIAAEKAAQTFMHKLDVSPRAAKYLKHTYRAYKNWGAQVKVKKLFYQYPSILSEENSDSKSHHVHSYVQSLENTDCAGSSSSVLQGPTVVSFTSADNMY